jgi:hypothetical protein
MTLRSCPHCRSLVPLPQWAAHVRRHEDERRPSARARGYGAAHQAERRRWAEAVADGLVYCNRCGDTIRPGQPWDLGHDEQRRWSGPEHRWCNRAAPRHLARNGVSGAPQTVTQVSARDSTARNHQPGGQP